VRCLLGQQKPSRGCTSLFGQDAWRTRRKAMARIGVVPETPDAPPEMTAAQLLGFCARVAPRWNQAEAVARLERFDVPLHVRFERLSKGQKGAVMLALALGHAPDLLLLDDPTLGLDALARHGFYDELLGELADRGMTVFITTHDLSGVEGVADRVGILSNGRLAVDEPLESLKSRVRRLRVAGDQNPPPFRLLARAEREWGTELLVADFDEACFEHWRREAAPAAEAEALPLEDIFAAIVAPKKGELQ
jgi:ABC-2 type transport system ATP-binding protein